MKYIQVCSVLLLVAASTLGQYNYQAPPTTPRGTYLPPKNDAPGTTRRPPPNLTQEQIAAEGLNPDGEHEPGMPFDFTYAVKDDVGNDFSHNAESDGDVVKGEYRTLLPDGRLQIVKYTADWKNGYNAEITYEGEASYPEPKPTTPRPRTPPRPAQPTRNPYENSEDIDSQSLTPARPPPRQPATRPPPPPPPRTSRPPPPPPPPRQSRPPPPPPPPRTPAPPPRTPPPPPPGLYGAPSVPFGVRNNPKFGYSK